MQSGFRQDTTLKQNLQLRVDPRVVLTGQLLELNTIELKTAIEAELQENPALEWLDEGLEFTSEEDILASVAPDELKPSSEDWEIARSKPQDASETDWMDFAASFDSLEHHLEAQLSAKIRPELHPVVDVVIASLDDRGYLGTPTEEIALDHNFDLDHVEEVLAALHTCEPAGIGARTLQECLALQVRDASTHEAELAHKIITEAFDDLVQRNVRPIMRRFRVVPELVQAAFDEIMELNPFPADSFARDQNWQRQSTGVAVPVDLKLSRTEMGWNVELPGIQSEDLIISRSYRDRLAELERKSKEADERRHLNEGINRAKVFIEALRQRGATLRRVGYYLIDQQGGFVLTGDVSHLRSLTRRKMAADLGLHESTISRATAGKHLQLANGETISFDVLFKPALRIQQMILDILSNEKGGTPLSDERIAQMLAEKGVHVARRTVNKYRDRSKTLSSRKRRSA